MKYPVRVYETFFGDRGEIYLSMSFCLLSMGSFI